MAKVIIDTDTGIDDAMALLLAFASPELDIVGISTVAGNVEVEDCTRNVLHTLELANVDLPVYPGAVASIMGGPQLRAFAVHGPTGLGPFTASPRREAEKRHAVDWMIETILSDPGEIDILALGPLTNVALAIATDRRVASAIRSVVYMGGVTLGHGNVGPISTFNVTADAEATHLVLTAGLDRVVQVGQDVTRHVRMHEADDDRLVAAGGPVMEFLAGLTAHGHAVSKGVEPGVSGHAIHDVVATTYLIDPSLFESRLVHVRVSLSDPLTRGATIADYRPSSIPGDYERLDVPAANCHMCLKADRDRIVDLYLERVISRYSQVTQAEVAN